VPIEQEAAAKKPSPKSRISRNHPHAYQQNSFNPMITNSNSKAGTLKHKDSRQSFKQTFSINDALNTLTLQVDKIHANE